MNRHQRKAEKSAKLRGILEVPLDDALIKSGIKDGDIFTISGLKRTKTGKVIRNCKPGKESKWMAKAI